MTMTAAELVEEAINLADEFARADVECNCPCVDRGPPPHWDTSALKPDQDATVLRSVKYCEMRKLLRRLPEQPHIVYFV